jgi:hypothetical protein
VTDPHRASDDLLIQLVREGRHDAEIAVRLGITTGELRERKAQLRGKLGDEKYLAATAAKVTPRRLSGRKRLFLFGMLAAAGSLAVLLVVANVLVGNGDEQASTRTAPSPTARIAATLKPPLVMSVDGRDFYDAGKFFVPGGKPGNAEVALADNRPGLSAVVLRETAYIQATEFADWHVTNSGRGFLRLSGTVGDKSIDLAVTAQQDGTQLRTLRANVGPLAEVSSQFSSVPATLLIRAWGRNTQLHELRVSGDGRLLVSRDPLPREWVIEEFTGARLDVTEAGILGKFSSGSPSQFTRCDQSAPVLRCTVVVNTTMSILSAAGPGTVTCDGARTARFESGEFAVEFQRRAGTGCIINGAVAAGQQILEPGQWTLSTLGAEESDRSVVVAGDGTVYVGAVRGVVACPCLGGN